MQHNYMKLYFVKVFLVLYNLAKVMCYFFKDYRDHDFPNTEFSYSLTIDTRQ